ncbi:MAG: hypothetical protein EAZ76_08000 [Nostocales cyanobacterium]|nr:MAG: hypothetical protein EAZ87_21320 [Nostocales cyanobacterium]TAF16115.1 MAG: hypothetical protein EAZ76_08000 [Nostocales cyanobacterium]
MTPKMPRRIKCNGFKEGNLLSLKDVAKRLFFDESTVRYHFIRRRLVGFRNNGVWWFTEDSVKSFENYLKTSGNLKKSKDKK